MIGKLQRWVLAVGVMTLGFTVAATVPTAPAHAAGCDGGFLTFPTWYRGLTDADCNIKQPGGDADAVGAFVWRIVLNIIEIVLQVIAYLTAGYLIFGGYRYLTSSGLPEKTLRARKTILNAIIGLVISFMSIAIVNLVAGNITQPTPGNCAATTNGKIDPDCVGIAQVGADSAINGVLNTAYFAAGMTAVIVIIICGILYSISQGDAAKTKRAKDGILYAVVGLVVIMMAFVITNFVIGRF